MLKQLRPLTGTWQYLPLHDFVLGMSLGIVGLILQIWRAHRVDTTASQNVLSVAGDLTLAPRSLILQTQYMYGHLLVNHSSRVLITLQQRIT